MQHQHKTEKIKKLTNFASDAIINSRNMWYYQLEKGVPIFYTGTQILLPRVSERIDIMQDMKTSKIKLNEASEVEEFVKAAGKCDFDIDIFYNRVIIDAKSILGIMSMDLTQAELGTEVLGKMPINPLYAEAADKGAFHAVENEYLDKAVEKIVG